MRLSTFFFLTGWSLLIIAAIMGNLASFIPGTAGLLCLFTSGAIRYRRARYDYQHRP